MNVYSTKLMAIVADLFTHAEGMNTKQYNWTCYERYILTTSPIPINTNTIVRRNDIVKLWVNGKKQV